MELTALAQSRVPNALAVAATALLILATLPGMKKRFVYVIPFLAMASVVVIKNIAYSLYVSGAEYVMAARRDYADALLWVVIAQVAIGVYLLVVSFASNDVGWVSRMAAYTCGYAALCMYGWRLAYLDTPAGQPVYYEVWAPWLHWVMIVGFIPVLVATLVSVINRLIRDMKQP